MSRIGKSIETEGELMAALHLGEVVGKWRTAADEYGVSFQHDEYNLNLLVLKVAQPSE